MGSPEEPKIAVASSAPPTRVANAAPTAAPATQSDGGFFSNLARKVGFGTADTTAGTAQPAPAKPKVIETKRNDPPHPEGSAPKAAAAPKAADTKQAAARPPLKPTVSDSQAAEPAPAAKDSPVVAGSAPIVQSNSFDSRFSAAK
jgi:hypothetical protein